LGARAYNHDLQAFDEFCKWLVATKRLVANPIAGLDRLNTETDIRHKQRALTLEDVSRLIESARSSGVSFQGYSAEERARIYVFSFVMGLRRQEMASLTSRSFDLDARHHTELLSRREPDWWAARQTLDGVQSTRDTQYRSKPFRLNGGDKLERGEKCDDSSSAYWHWRP
jgi:site-specific recombinase XerC